MTFTSTKHRSGDDLLESYRMNEIYHRGRVDSLTTPLLDTDVIIR
jgi:hypothetical protein